MYSKQRWDRQQDRGTARGIKGQGARERWRKKQQGQREREKKKKARKKDGGQRRKDEEREQDTDCQRKTRTGSWTG